MYRRIQALIARRDLKIGGATVLKGARLTTAQARSVRRIDSLVASGAVEAQPEVYGRRGVHGPEPVYVTPGMRNVMTLMAWQDGNDEHTWNFAVSSAGGSGAAYVFDFGDESLTASDADGATSHEYAEEGVYTVVVTSGLQTATLEVVVSSLNTEVDPEDFLTYTFTVTPPGQGPVMFDFGDGSDPIVDADGIVTYTYEESGVYTAVAMLNEQVASATVTIGE